MEEQVMDLMMQMLGREGAVFALTFGAVVVLFGCYIRWKGVDDKVTTALIDDLLEDRRDLRARAQDTFRLEQQYVALINFAERLVLMLDHLDYPHSEEIRTELEDFYQLYAVER